MLPGTRSMSPKDVKITPGHAAITSDLSICSSGVTHTGHPGPWASEISGGSSSSMPNLTIEWVCPPHTSINVHGRVVIAANRRGQLLRGFAVAVFVDELHLGTSSPISSARSPIERR